MYSGSMAIEVDIAENLTHRLRVGLALPPSRAGLRLRAERELAERLQIGRKLVRRSLDLLVEEGILVRRHGSGTYVRRVPRIENPRDVADAVDTAHLFNEQESDSEPAPLQPTAAQKCLHLELWSGFHRTTATNKKILESMAERTEELGHMLTVHSIIQNEDKPLALEQLAARLRAGPGDGYLVTAQLADLYEQAYRMAFGPATKPVVFVAPGSQAMDHEPMVFMDTDEAIRRALRTLNANGFSRIGILVIHSPLRHGNRDAGVYEHAMADLGLAYRGVEFCQRTPEDGYAAMLRLIDREDRPDALYVTNDEILSGVARAMEERKMVAGRDMGVITLANRQRRELHAQAWSRMEFDPTIVGKTAVDSLVRAIQTAGEEVLSSAHLARWRPGDTHRKN